MAKYLFAFCLKKKKFSFIHFPLRRPMFGVTARAPDQFLSAAALGAESKVNIKKKKRKASGESFSKINWKLDCLRLKYTKRSFPCLNFAS
jgi:hypothetical protein